MTPQERLEQVANECIELGHCYQNDASFDFALRVYFLAKGIDIYGD